MMKKFWMIGILALGFASCQKNVSQVAVPDKVVASFNQRYPYARNVDWEMKKGLYEADFTDTNGKDKEVYYRTDGTLVRVDE